MAHKEISYTEYYDDLDGTPVEKDDLSKIRFSIGNKEYILEVTKANGEKFKDAVKPFVDAATRVTGTTVRAEKPKAPKATAADTARNAAVRAWGREAGLFVSTRGRVPNILLDAYDEAEKNGTLASGPDVTAMIKGGLDLAGADGERVESEPETGVDVDAEAEDAGVLAVELADPDEDTADTDTGADNLPEVPEVPTEPGERREFARAWARANGYEVKDTGFLPKAVTEAFEASVAVTV